VSSKSRRREREQGVRKNPNESKTSAASRGIDINRNTSRPWRAPLRRILGRKRTELKKEGYLPRANHPISTRSVRPARRR
jgi:hypothetical protein